ncbi:MAG TPA: tripartite tricarboxylate transporter substrate-binding protein [Stellaceae bacterium]|jgi:tripartite-type tricarboxylate transporter receptor subunit TctC|nr:tripartite tricarboxylate transporter substrate-binding protein [Stellaceae bacterium]
MDVLKRAAVAGAVLLAAPSAFAADTVADFYKGRTVTIDIGYSAGGGYDLYARTLARHLGEHIPGKPSVIPQNMPGAGSLKATNYLYNIAPKDGTVIATFARGMAMQPLFDKTGVEFDAQKLNWIGSITNEVSICAFRSDSGIKTWQDMLTKSYTVGGTGSGSDTDVFPDVLRHMFHMKIKLVTGYPGGKDILLAMQRGEVKGRCGWSWSSVKSTSYALYQKKEITVPVQLALKKHPDLPDVPLIMDLTKDPDERAALRLIFGRQSVARPYAAPPGVPAERIAALRKAFDDTMKDPAFLAEADKTKLEVEPVSGEEVQALVTEIYKSSPKVVKIAADAVKGGD